MKLSTETGVLTKAFGAERALRMIAEAGFTAVDFDLYARTFSWEEAPFSDPSSDAFIQHFKGVGELAASLGLEIYMAHAPCCATDCADPAAYPALRQKIARSVLAAHFLGCPNLVVHPVMHPDFSSGQNAEEAVQVNVDYFSPLAGVLRETGVTLCIENLFWGEYGKPKIPNACSGAEQLSAVIDALNAMHGPLFAACLDTGHAAVAGNDPAVMLEQLGGRVRALHLHDNRGVLDDHLLPGSGIIDWPRFLKVLGAAGFEGTLNFETTVFLQNFIKSLYDETVPAAALRLLHTTGRRLLVLTEEP